MAFVTCPFCGTAVDEGTLRCPACRGDLSSTIRIPQARGTWCESCGALVPEGERACPACGLPITQAHLPERVAPTPAPDSLAATIDEVVPTVGVPSYPAPVEEPPHIKPAVPAAPAPGLTYDDAAESDAPPHTSRVLVFVLVAAAAMIAVVMAITHPWNPDANSTHATTEVDTSMVGFPGERDALASQDKASIPSAEGGIQTAEEATYDTLHELWESLGELEGELDASESLLRDMVSGEASDKTVTQAYEEATYTAMAISNAVSAADEVGVTTGTYEEEVRNVATLGSWLRNWSDTLCDAWDGVRSSGDASDARVYAVLDASASADGINAYHALFDEHYAQWEPLPHESSN